MMVDTIVKRWYVYMDRFYDSPVPSEKYQSISKPIIGIRNGGERVSFRSCREASRKLRISLRKIYDGLNKQKTINNWRFENV